MKLRSIFCSAMVVGAASVANAQLTQLWEVAAIDAATNPTTYIVSSSGDNERGAAYNPATGHILVVSRVSTGSVKIVDSTNGAKLGELNVTGVSGGSIVLGKIAVDSTGVIYACDIAVTAGTNPFKVYRWSNEAAVPTTAVNDLTNTQRLGDSFAIKGTGTGTVIYSSGTSNANIEVYTTSDGVAFTPGTDISLASLTPPLAAGDARSGIAIDSATGDMYIQDAGDKTRLITGTTDTDGNTSVIGASVDGASFINAGGKKLLGAHVGTISPQGGRSYDVTTGIGVGQAVAIQPTQSQGTTTNTNGTGQAFWFIDATSQLRLGMLSTNNGIGVFGNNTEFGVTAAVASWSLYD